MDFSTIIVSVNIISLLFVLGVSYFVILPYGESWLGGNKLIPNPKIDRLVLFVHFGLLFLIIIFFMSLYGIKTPYNAFDKTIIVVITLVNIGLSILSYLFYKNKDKLLSKNDKPMLKNTIYNNYLNEIEKWEEVYKKLNEDSVINNEGEWISLGPNLSKPATQLAVFIFLMDSHKIVDINKRNQNRSVEILAKYFKVNLSPSRYSNVKKGFDDTNGISKSMMHYPIYEKLKSYF